MTVLCDKELLRFYANEKSLSAETKLFLSLDISVCLTNISELSDYWRRYSVPSVGYSQRTGIADWRIVIRCGILIYYCLAEYNFGLLFADLPSTGIQYT